MTQSWTKEEVDLLIERRIRLLLVPWLKRSPFRLLSKAALAQELS